jgi:hypothetical protein
MIPRCRTSFIFTGILETAMDIKGILKIAVIAVIAVVVAKKLPVIGPLVS